MAQEEIGQTTEALKSVAGEAVGESRDEAEQVWDDARGRARRFKQDAEQYVRDNPTIAVLSALGIGFVVGLTIYRR